MAQVIKKTKYRNWQIVIKTDNNITFIIKLLLAKKMFKKILKYSSRDNSKSANMDLF